VFGVTLPEDVTELFNKNSSAIASPSSYLISVNYIPSNITSIGKEAFTYCSNLNSIIIPEGITHIKDWAFRYNYKLTSITLPTTIEYLGWRFLSHNGVKTIICKATTAPTINESAFFFSSGGTFYYPKGSDYSSILESSTFKNSGWTGVEI